MRFIAYVMILKVRKSHGKTLGEEVQMGFSLPQKQWAMTLAPSKHVSVSAK